ncbi:competence protein CoiA [Jeotgalibacillus proteolyticus]|uniref:competence protein CoiA n=1 Tax=Jeotgalibacillus proteolyticus TaxID=2082395 RepID=UPI0014315F3C|nr:competence protein CoiA family protein [Jeotgalibacillus proteolyticus]
MLTILVAKTEKGKVIFLDGTHSPHVIRTRFANTSFYCPQCNEKLQLKVGSIKIPHFAHVTKSLCDSYSEPETKEHLLAKYKLYRWLKTQGWDVSVEKPYPDLGQRSDLSTVLNGQEFAVEFQCSSLSYGQYRKRTEGYYKRNIIPLWILAASKFPNGKSRFSHKLPLSSFHQQFIRYSSSLGQYFLIFYNAEKESIILLQPIIAISKNSFLTMHSETRVFSLTFPHFPLPSISLSSIDLKIFIQARKKWQENRIIYGKGNKDFLLSEFYQNQLFIHLLPLWVGLPVRHALAIKEPVFEWQAYLYLLLIRNDRTNRAVSLKQLKDLISRLIKTNKISRRLMHDTSNEGVLKAVEEYILLLKKLAILDGQSEFKLNQENPFVKQPSTPYKENEVEEFWRIKGKEIIHQFNERQ